MQSDILYLASNSLGRQRLLKQAGVNFIQLAHTSDENLIYDNLAFPQYVLTIARHKMSNICLPKLEDVEKNYIFVLTADTLVRDPRHDRIFAKPKDMKEALEMLSKEREGPVEVVSAFCLARYQKATTWLQENLIEEISTSKVEFYVDKNREESYFKTYPFVLGCAGAGSIEAFGGAFLKSIEGSYSGVIGLPLYEFLQALKRINFRL